MMGLKTIYEYDDEIKKIDEILHSFKGYIEECPEDSGTKWNYESLKYIRNELKKERDKLEDYTHKRNRMIEKMCEIILEFGKLMSVTDTENWEEIHHIGYKIAEELNLEYFGYYNAKEEL